MKEILFYLNLKIKYSYQSIMIQVQRRFMYLFHLTFKDIYRQLSVILQLKDYNEQITGFYSNKTSRILQILFQNYNETIKKNIENNLDFLKKEFQSLFYKVLLSQGFFKIELELSTDNQSAGWFSELFKQGEFLPWSKQYHASLLIGEQTYTISNDGKYHQRMNRARILKNDRKYYRIRLLDFFPLDQWVDDFGDFIQSNFVQLLQNMKNDYDASILKLQEFEQRLGNPYKKPDNISESEISIGPNDNSYLQEGDKNLQKSERLRNSRVANEKSGQKLEDTNSLNKVNLQSQRLSKQSQTTAKFLSMFQSKKIQNKALEESQIDKDYSERIQEFKKRIFTNVKFENKLKEMASKFAKQFWHHYEDVLDPKLKKDQMDKSDKLVQGDFNTNIFSQFSWIIAETQIIKKTAGIFGTTNPVAELVYTLKEILEDKIEPLPRNMLLVKLLTNIYEN